MRDIIIFVLAYIEGLPIITIFFPGAMIAVIIGSFTHDGYITPLIAIHLVAIGGFLGDITSLYLGPKLLRIKMFKKFVEKESYQKYWSIFDKHIALIIVFSKLLPTVRSTPSLFAGARNISKLKYYFYALLGSYLWAVLGIYGGNFLAQIFGGYAIPMVFAIFILAGLVAYLFKKK